MSYTLRDIGLNLQPSVSGLKTETLATREFAKDELPELSGKLVADASGDAQLGKLFASWHLGQVTKAASGQQNAGHLLRLFQITSGASRQRHRDFDDQRSKRRPERGLLHRVSLFFSRYSISMLGHMDICPLVDGCYCVSARVTYAAM